MMWKLLIQVNLSTILWDPDQNVGESRDLPDTPNRTTPVPALLFCGDPQITMETTQRPFYNTWTYPTSKDCQRLTPEPQDSDGSSPAYEQDDAMLVGRTMGQFITVPDGTMLVRPARLASPAKPELVDAWPGLVRRYEWDSV
ncbi:hypothetical protein L210DRAFT_3644019 [Boletus edulis BED1]|uniref:Uncharacterized protein n=1 Tax=Boletus edulis BED1 TaxID=1328754 RepID=A0AAD4BY22_BOLED|nr:hypothetical protein L210DRAFT_3644019 [Boletus edulis BED1]